MLQPPQSRQPAAAAAAAVLSAKQLQQHYASLYDQLQDLGFATEHVQSALAAVQYPAAAAAGLEDCLDWLCLNVEQQLLPRRFTGSSRAAAGNIAVKVGRLVVLYNR